MQIHARITKEESDDLDRGVTVTVVFPFDSIKVAVEGQPSRDAEVIAANVTKDSRSKVKHQLFISLKKG